MKSALSSTCMMSLMLTQCWINCKHLSISVDWIRHCPQNCKVRDSLSWGFVLWFYFFHHIITDASVFYKGTNQFYSSWFTSISQSSFFLQPHNMARLHSMRTSGAILTPVYFSLSHTHTYCSQDISVLPDRYSSRERKTLWIKISIYRERLCPCVSKVLYS